MDLDVDWTWTWTSIGIRVSGIQRTQWTQTVCQILPDFRSSVLFLSPTTFLFSSYRKRMEAMVVELDTFDSHPPFLLNGDVGTGCLRVVFQQVSPCTSLLFLCAQGRCSLRDHGAFSIFP